MLVVVACLVVACSGGDDDDAADDESTTTTEGDEGDGEGEGEGDEGVVGESWTVLQYSMADNNLEEPMLADIKELGEVGSQEGLNLVALVDRHVEESDVELGSIGVWTGAKVLLVDQGDFTEVADLGDTNTGDPAVLADFITQGFGDNPADHYALIISDHGASWPGIGPDDSFGDSMELAEFQAALEQGLDGAGIDRLDLIGFDACLMASYEVATAMQPYADRMIASEELEPGHGWDYRAFQVLADDPSTDVDTLGTAIVDGFQAQAEANQTADAITLSLLDLTQMPALDEAMTAFTQALIERGADIAPIVAKSQAETLSFGRNPDEALSSHVTDLRLLVSGIGVEALDLSDETDAVEQAINDVVLYNVDSPATLGASGMTVYFPPTQALFDAAYNAAPGTDVWGAFLASYYDAGAAIPEEEQAKFLEDEPDVFFDQDGLNIIGQFESLVAENLAEAFITYALPEADGSFTYFGQEPAIIQDDGTVLGIYDLTQLVIKDNTDEAVAYVGLSWDDDGGFGTIDVPMVYFAPEDVGTDIFSDVVLLIVFDSETGDVVQETYYVVDEESGTWGELSAEPDGIVIPKVPNYLADGTEQWLPTSDVGLFADLPNLVYELRPLPSGTPLHAELTVVDFGGNTDTVAVDVVVP